ncbi:MAG: uroporphyrinogen-III C-methyltransferase [Gammaproteobacteria bacterium]|nr:uroporphyrinogen-III C-methyltransferase [Gammaproteobacteria bacterium]
MSEETPAAAPRHSSPKAKTQKPAPRPQGSGSSGAFLAMVLALAAGGGSYYVWQQYLGAEQERRVLQQGIERLLEVVEQSEAAQRQRIEQLAGHRHAEVEQRLVVLERSLPALGQQLTLQQHDWSLAEVDYLLRLADHHLQLSHDLPGAIAALRQAHEQLARYGNGHYAGVAAHIAAQIEQLTALEESGAAVVIARLGTVLGMLEGLPFVTPLAHATTTPQPADTVPNEAAPLGERLRHWGRLVWQDLRSLVTIRRSGEGGRPLPATEQRQLSQAELRLALQSARLAVLTRNQPLFSASLQEAVELLNRDYDTGAAAVVEMLASLTQLATLPVAPELPSLQGVRQQLHAARPAVAGAAAADGAEGEESQP